MRIENARKEQAAQIARLIMLAMNHDCCQYFAGPDHTLDDFHRVMTELVERDDSQYSYRNTEVAVDDDGRLMGICVTYDGGRLRGLRRAFVEAARVAFGIDYSGMDDETQAGELYADSLAVEERDRLQGVASALLLSAAAKAKRMGLPAVGLLVDAGNPDAERLYRRVGFEYVNDAEWGSHPMHHLQRKVE